MDSYNDGDLYVNDGDNFNGIYYPTTDKEDVREDEVKLANQSASYPIMAELVDWWDEAIKELDSRTAILAFAEAYKCSPEDAGRAFDVARDLMSNKLNEFSEWRSER